VTKEQHILVQNNVKQGFLPNIFFFCFPSMAIIVVKLFGLEFAVVTFVESI
jgi:hypothetical protein